MVLNAVTLILINSLADSDIPLNALVVVAVATPSANDIVDPAMSVHPESAFAVANPPGAVALCNLILKIPAVPVL